MIHPAGNIIHQHLVNLDGGIINVQGRIDHQYFFEIKDLSLLVQFRHKGCLRAAEAVAGEIKI